MSTALRRVAILRMPERAEPLRAALAKRGFDVLVQPVTRTVFLEHPKEEDWAAMLRDADWVVFTSRTAVEALARGLGRMAALHEVLKAKHVAALGLESALQLRSAGIDAAIVERTGGAAELGERLVGALPRRAKVLHACAAQVGAALGESLHRAGHAYRRLVCYRTEPIPLTERGPLPWGELDAALVAAPSAVAAVADDPTRPRDFPFLAIGPTTAAALRARGMLVLGVAPVPGAETVAALIESLCPHRSKGA